MNAYNLALIPGDGRARTADVHTSPSLSAGCGTTTNNRQETARRNTLICDRHWKGSRGGIQNTATGAHDHGAAREVSGAGQPQDSAAAAPDLRSGSPENNTSTPAQR
jgi:hypothetical protein